MSTGNAMKIHVEKPDKTVLNQVKAGFIMQETTLEEFCKKKGFDPSNTRKALLGTWKGPKANKRRSILLKASKPKKAKPHEKK